MNDTKDKIISKEIAFKSLDSEFIYKIINLTSQGVLIPEADLKMLSQIDSNRIQTICERFEDDSLFYKDVEDISRIIAHNIAYPHRNLENVYELLGKTHKYLGDLYGSIDSNLLETDNTIFKKEDAFKSLDSDLIYKIINLTSQGLLIPESDLIMLSRIDFNRIKTIRERFESDSLFYKDVDDIATLVFHNYDHPHQNMSNVYELLYKSYEELRDLGHGIIDNFYNAKQS